jgi:hypothetical protein
MRFVTIDPDGTRQEREYPSPLSAVAGAGFDELVLAKHDLQQMRTLPPEKLHDLINHLLARSYSVPR